MAGNITNHKLAARELQRLRLLLDNVQEITPIGLWEYDLSSGQFIWSLQQFRLWGMDPAEAAPTYATLLAEHIHPDDRKMVDGTFQSAKELTEPYRFEHRIVRPDGSVRVLRHMAQPYRDENGVLISYIGATVEMSEQIQLELELTEKRGLLELFIEHSPSAIAMFDTQMRYLAASHRWRTDFGLEDVTLIGRSHYEIFPDLPKRWRSVHQRSLAGEVINCQEDRIVRANGATCWLRWETWPWRCASGKIGGLMIFSEDITQEKNILDQLRASEDRFRLAMDAAQDGIWDWNLLTGDCYFSPGYFRMLGYEVDSMPHRFDTWSDLLHPDDHDVMVARAQRVVESGQNLQLEFRLRAHDGSYRWIASRGKIVERDAEGKPVRAIGTHVDITKQKLAQEELEALNASLEQRVAERTQLAEAAAAAKSQFVANMSHEIRNPLNSISVLTHLLTHDGLNPAQQQLAKKIHTNVAGLARLVDDILDIAKIEAKQLILEQTPFSLSELIDPLHSLFDEAARIKGLHLHWPNLPSSESLLGDRLRLTQILSNLLDNALKFTENGDIWWDVSVAGHTSESITLNFQVIDTGIGIPAEAIPTLKEPFTQADSSITRRFGGTGLGLAITHHLIAGMGGQLSISSTLGLGSAFSFTLTFPLVKSLTSKPCPKLSKRLDGLRILIVDDDVNNLEGMEMALASVGAHIFTAADGGQAFDWLRDHAGGCDAVLMDIQMPVMDGITATRLIRNVLKLPNLPVWAVTAGVLPDQQAEALGVGINELIRKPIDVDALIEKLAAIPKQAASPTDDFP